MSVELKIKSKSLAAEASIIRSEENKILNRIEDLSDLQKPVDRLQEKYVSLRTHRVSNVRNEARATFLARGYIKGYPYAAVEASGRTKQGEALFKFHIVPRVVAMVNKYKPSLVVTKDMIMEWAKLPTDTVTEGAGIWHGHGGPKPAETKAA